MDNFDNAEMYSALNQRFSGENGSSQSAAKSSERSEGGGLWFVVLLPLIGLALQSFAVSKWAGLYLWAMMIAALFISTLLDYKCVVKNHPETDFSPIKKWIWLAPVYVFKREKLLGHETYKAFLLGGLMIAAISMNNFMTSTKITAEDMPEMIEDTPVSVLDNFSGNSPDYIGDRLSLWLGEEYESECTKEGDTFTAVFSGIHEGKQASVEIEVVHDGFVYKSVKVSTITMDGKKLEDDDFKDTLKEIFIPGEVGGEENEEADEAA